MYARTELQNQRYLFLYSQEQTVNMIQQKHLKMLAQMLLQRYSRTLHRKTLEILLRYLKIQLIRHRLLCSQVDLVQVMNLMAQLSSSQQHLETQRLKKLYISY